MSEQVVKVGLAEMRLTPNASASPDSPALHSRGKTPQIFLSLMVVPCLCAFFNLPGSDTNLSAKIADEIVTGKLKRAMKVIKSGEAVPKQLKRDIEALLGLNKSVALEYKRKIGREVDFYARRHLKRGTLLKVEKGKIYVKITTGNASAKWPVKISSLPIAFKMRMVGISDSAKKLYFGIKSLRAGEFAAAKACFDTLKDVSTPLLKAADRKYGRVYSLSEACFAGETKKLQRLLSEKADPNLKIIAYTRNKRTKKVEKRSSTLLIETIKRSKAATVKTLLDNGADPNAADSKGITPLMYAVAFFPKDTSVLQYLLEKHADATAFDNDGNTALSGAIAYRRLEAFKLLIDRTPNINAPCGKGFTPLMMAVMSNNYDMFKILIDMGADMTVRHAQGWTVLDINRDRMHPKIKAVLDSVSPRKRIRRSPRSHGMSIVPQRR